MAKALTYQELMELAKQHYNEGGDRTFECCDKRFFDDYVKQFGPITKKVALSWFEVDKQIDNMIDSMSW